MSHKAKDCWGDDICGEKWQIQQQKKGDGAEKQAWDFIPEVWSLPSLLVIPQRSQRALHLEVSESVLQPTPPRQMFSWGRGGGCFSPSDQRLCLLPGECRARREREGKKTVNERWDPVFVTDTIQNYANVRSIDRTSLSSDILHIFSRPASPPSLCILFEVNPVLFVPHAACSCCRLFYKSIARLTSLVFYQFLCRMSLCRVPALQRETRYSIHGIMGGRSSKRYHSGVIFIGRYQTAIYLSHIQYIDLYADKTQR